MECIDRYGVTNHFKYAIEECEEIDFEKYIFRVVPRDVVTDDWFELSIVKIDNRTGKVSAMNNNNVPELSGKGIPEKLIELATAQLNVQIISSSNIPSSKVLDAEWRSTDADKLWKRLVQNNKATYDNNLDVYTYCP